MSSPYDDEWPVTHPELGSGEVSYDPSKPIIHFGSPPVVYVPRPRPWWRRFFGLE